MALKSPIVFREIKSDLHLAAYSQFTQKYLDVCYPLEYLKRSKVIAIVTETDCGDIQTMFGGYILSLNGPFRVLEQLPREIVEGHQELQEKIEKCFELTGLWIHPVLKNGPLRAKFWLRLFGDLVIQTAKGKCYPLYSYDSSKTKLGEIYSICKPSRIYEGHVFIEGMAEKTSEIVEMGSIPAVIKAFYKEPAFIARFLGKRLFRNHRSGQKQNSTLDPIEIPAFN